MNSLRARHPIGIGGSTGQYANMELFCHLLHLYCEYEKILELLLVNNMSICQNALS